MKPPDFSDIDIIEACRHPKLLGIPLSVGQSMFLKAADGLELTQEELDLYVCTSGHDSYRPGYFVRFPGLLAGRRFGKSFHVAIPMALHAACFRSYPNMRPGESPTVLFLATTIPQASIDHKGMIEALRNSSTLKCLLPMFSRKDRISLKNGVDIITMRCDLRSVRGLAIVMCVAEELCFWRSEEDNTVNPAEETLAAVYPSLLQFEYGRLAMISSAWAKTGGPLMAAYAKRSDDPLSLVCKMTSQMGNPTLSAELLEQEKQRDFDRYSREILAEPVDAAAALLPSDALDACVARGRYENPPKPGVTYHLGLDVAFRSDQFGAVWSHTEGEKVVVDCARGWTPKPGRPVNFNTTMNEIVELCRCYGCTRASADMVANEVVKQRLAQAGIRLEQVSTGGRRSGGIYQSLRAKVLAGQAEILDHPELLSQLRKLEVTRSGGGGERVEAASGHDDMATACTLAVYESLARGKPNKPWIEVLDVGGARSERMWQSM